MKIYCSNCGKNKSFMCTAANVKRIINMGWGSFGGALYCPKCVSTWGERNTSELSSMDNTFRLILKIHENDKKKEVRRMINRVTKITIEYCPREDGEVDFDQDCNECKYYKGMNKDYEVLCNYGEECEE